MKSLRWLTLITILFLFACQPSTTTSTVTIMDGTQIKTLQTNERVPSALLKDAGIAFGQNDSLLFYGHIISLDQSLPDLASITLQVRRALTLTLITPQGQQSIQSSAFTVGEVLQNAGYVLYANDKIDPPANTPITNPLTINYSPSRELTISADGRSIQIRSSSGTVGAALAEAGIPLIGFDYSRPAENEALPPDGQINIVRVSESVLLAQKPIPFKAEFQASADVELDQQQVLQPGETGLSISRIRIRYENGQEISRVTESETTVRAPKARIVGYGTKIVIKSAVVEGVKIEYWRAVQMYATSYSPCRLGTSTCGSTTASGKTLKKGMVALRTDLYFSLRGQQLYIPGYGYASVEDACGGCVGKPWIDLGYSDGDWQQWSSWVTVYFLTPVPSNILYVLE